MPNDYHKNLAVTLTVRLRAIIDELPAFCGDFFIGLSSRTQVKTRIAYAFDLRIFFHYITTSVPIFTGIDAKDLDLADMDKIRAADIEKFTEFLSAYSLPDSKDPSKMVTYTNGLQGKMRKLSTLRTFYRYYFRQERIRTNPALLVDLPKLRSKEIIRLDAGESAKLLDEVENGESLTPRQKKFHEKTGLRDLAVITLLLGTGIRVGECVGLNVSDFNFENNAFTVTRKGGESTILFLPDEVTGTLLDYLKEFRGKARPAGGHEDAMFLSTRMTRLSVSSIEKMLKKYAANVVPLKNISPHKLRSTYGTNLYRETGDVYLVAEVLGHKDVNTTRKHYAALDEDRKRIAAQATKLRK